MARSKNPLSLEFIILGFLNEKSAHGYDIYRQIAASDTISLIWNIKQSRFYTLLDKLEHDGLVTSKVLKGETLPYRKEFQITPRGEAEFLAWAKAPVEHGREMRQVFLAKLFFTQKTTEDLTQVLAGNQKKVCEGWLAGCQASLKGLKGGQNFERAVYQYRISQTQAMINWLDWLMADEK